MDNKSITLRIYALLGRASKLFTHNMFTITQYTQAYGAHIFVWKMIGTRAQHIQACELYQVTQIHLFSCLKTTHLRWVWRTSIYIMHTHAHRACAFLYYVTFTHTMFNLETENIWPMMIRFELKSVLPFASFKIVKLSVRRRASLTFIFRPPIANLLKDIQLEIVNSEYILFNNACISNSKDSVTGN